MQGEELLALADTIKILNDDDALELFKKTLPGSASSFLQIQVTEQSALRKALQTLKDNRRGNDPRVDLIEVALRSGKLGFEKIIKLIDELTAKLKEEQAEADAEESITNLKAEMEALDDGIRALDKEVAEATENRKAEHDDFEATYAANTAAVDLLKFAKNRLNKFYNPKLYKPPPKRELSEDEQITLNMGGTLAPTAAPGGIAGTGIGLVQAAPPPPPEANLAYKTKGEESSGVIQMIDNLVNDVEKENQVMKLEEEDAQDDYEKFMADAKEKRAADSKSMSDAEGSLAETDEQMVTDKGTLKDKNTELMETDKYLSGLHADCDWLIKYYDMRKEARTGEIDAMAKAKDVLNGASYS